MRSACDMGKGQVLQQELLFLLLPLVSTEIMYFPFDKISGGKVIGPQLNGTAMHSPVLVPGIKGQALSLDGVDQYVDFGNQR